MTPCFICLENYTFQDWNRRKTENMNRPITGNELESIIKTKETKYCMTSFRQNVQQRQIYTDRKQICGYLEPWVEEELTVNWHKWYYWEMKMFSNWCIVMVVPLGKVTKNPWTVHWRWVGLVIYTMPIDTFVKEC